MKELCTCASSILIVFNNTEIFYSNSFGGGKTIKINIYHEWMSIGVLVGDGRWIII